MIVASPNDERQFIRAMPGYVLLGAPAWIARNVVDVSFSTTITFTNSGDQPPQFTTALTFTSTFSSKDSFTTFTTGLNFKSSFSADSGYIATGRNRGRHARELC